MAPARLTGRKAFLDLLQDEGVSHVFGNPGTTELPLMEALPHAPGLQYVLGLQESVVVAMADGFARASGRLTACNLHAMPGLGHAMGALYSAKFAGSPVIVTAGQYEIGHGLTEPMLYEPLVPIAQPLVKWSVEPQRVEDLPRIVRRAAKVAMTPPRGPVFISLPGSILDAEAELDLGASTRVEAHGIPAPRVQQAMVEALLGSASPVIIAGRELAEQGAMGAAGELAELLGSPVWHEPVAYNGRFPTAHPCFMGDLSRNQRKVRESLQGHDLLVVLGADLLRMSVYSPVDPLPPGLRVLHVSEREWELGKNHATELAVRAGVAETLAVLLPVLRERQSEGARVAARARVAQLQSRNWSARRVALLASAPSASASGAMQPLALVRELVQALPPGAICVEEAPTTAPLLASLLPVEQGLDFLGLASGGLGFGMGGAVGAALARPGTPVAAMIGDGSAMYAIQALWTAAHHRLPVVYVIVNNRSYRIIKERLVSARHSDRFLGMDFADPPLDFVAMAKGMGVEGVRVSDPRELGSALRQAFAGRKPFLIDAVVDTPALSLRA
jgi:benzoylformate decarboxylase